MARVPQAMSSIRKRDHIPVISQPSDLDRQPRRGLNGSFTSSAKELKADGDMNSILKSRTEAATPNARFDLAECPEMSLTP